MKKYTIAAFFAAMVLSVGCATTVSLPDRLDKFVEKTEQEYKNYDEKDWEKSKAEYDALVAEMKENYDSYSTTDKVRTMKAVSRYGTILLSKELSSASESVGDVLEQIPETINDIIDQIDTVAIRQTVEDIKGSIDTGAIRKSVEGIINSIDTARLRKSIEGITENIDTARLRQKLEAIIGIFTGGAEEE